MSAASAPRPASPLASTTVFILGAGGLGAPLALFLAQAGVGHLKIADDDRIERSNLHRQILHTTARIGQSKVESLRESLRNHHPDTRVTPIDARITADNLYPHLTGCDIVADGCDNFASRDLLNQACMERGMPLVSGAVSGLEGQVATFFHGVDPEAPCYRCLYPTLEHRETPPTCATAGILGPVAGVVAALQAIETIRIALQRPAQPPGLLLINLLNHQMMRIALPKNPECPVCRDHITHRPPSKRDDCSLRPFGLS
ncbi:MAG: HesA/MoeB/ThiF family protein [Magnetococcales bacterium]|nr:HesA/MoeB/ThiF family protein [Magnetococcales bacterium]